MKKSISEAQVKRMRNLVTKKYGAKTEIRAGYTKKRESRAEGEVWLERGKTWTIKNGIKQNISRLSEARRTIRKPLCCPKCGGSMDSRWHTKMWKLHGMCFTCVVKFENQLRLDGKFEEYEKQIMKGNYAAWLKDVEQEYKDFINTDVGRKYITEAGHIEDWKGDNKEKLVQKASTHIDKIKKEFEDTIDG